MKIAPFKLERYFDKYEFSVPYLLSCSDCEPLSLNELLEMANNETSKLWDNLWLGYTESKGHNLLREEIAQLYTNIGKDDVVVVVPEEGIYIAMNILLDKGDHIITTFPGYQSLYEIAIGLNCSLSKWMPDENMDFKVDDLQKLITNKTKLIVINFPHNPSGATISIVDLKKIVQIARDNDVVIFSDEMYRLLEYDQKDRLPSVCDIYENSISLFGLSKSFSLPGLRLGWLTTQNKKFLNEIIGYKDYTTICSSAPSEILAIIALQNKDRILRNNLNTIESNILLINGFIERHKDMFAWKEPIAGPVAFPEIKITESLSGFCEKLATEEGIMLLPSDVYDYPEKAARLGFGRKSFPESLNAFDQYLQKL